MNDAFKNVFLLQFLMSIASASVSVFIFVQPGDWTNRTKFLLYFVVIISESSYYCVPSEIIKNSASELSKSLYESKWYNTDVSQFKKCIVLVIARAQKTINFSGYGLVYINLQTFIVICKTVFTFYTYLNSARKISSE
nr:PREDICTED: uncharacterized protein LOC107398535 [Tribolium castaneum]|eukprot:XP_015838360.1 PREDICTED: uncharacterized protein LOC107398535 [Tribolium castaneum]